MSLPAILLTIFLSIAGMELFAWWAHKYVMHGWGWGWHRDGVTIYIVLVRGLGHRVVPPCSR